MRQLGLVIMTASFLPWVAIFLVVPYLSLSMTQTALLVIVLIIIAEVLSWLSMLLVGEELVRKYRSYLNLDFWKTQLQKIWYRRK